MAKEIEITKEKIEEAYKNNSNARGAKTLKISPPKLLDFVRYYKIPEKKRGNGVRTKRRFKIIG